MGVLEQESHAEAVACLWGGLLELSLTGAGIFPCDF